ncbi:MAG: hypothetical protein AAFU73_13510 [Planctomycetota bacterium]
MLAKSLSAAILIAALAPATVTNLTFDGGNLPCIPWESPDGGARDISFKRPDIAPEVGKYEPWTDPISGNEIPHGFPQVWEDDRITGGPGLAPGPHSTYDDHMTTATASPDGEQITLRVENHLTRDLTDQNVNTIDGPGKCIELYAFWHATRLKQVTIHPPYGENPYTITVPERFYVLVTYDVCPC